MVYSYTKFHKNILNRFSYEADMISIMVNKKGHHSVSTVHIRGVTVIVLCTSSNHGLHLYQVLQNYIALSDMERTRFQYQ